jgi:hypothetical protein
MDNELQDFIEENEFERVQGHLKLDDLWVCPDGHVWHIDAIKDLLWEEQQEKARKNCDWS